MVKGQLRLATWPIRLANVKCHVSDDGDCVDGHIVDTRTGRTVPAPLDHPFDRRGRAFELGFHGTITSIANPATDVLGARLFATRIAKPHALHASFSDDAHTRGL